MREMQFSSPPRVSKPTHCMRSLYITSALLAPLLAHSDPTCVTVAWPNGAGCAVLPVADVGFVDAVDAEVPWVQSAHVDGVLILKGRLS